MDDCGSIGINLVQVGTWVSRASSLISLFVYFFFISTNPNLLAGKKKEGKNVPPYSSRAPSIVTGPPSDASVNLRMASMDPIAIRYLLFQEYIRDIGPVLSVEAL